MYKPSTFEIRIKTRAQTGVNVTNETLAKTNVADGTVTITSDAQTTKIDVTSTRTDEMTETTSTNQQVGKETKNAIMDNTATTSAKVTKTDQTFSVSIATSMVTLHAIAGTNKKGTTKTTSKHKYSIQNCK